ncbi:NAD(P)/FAD-dependent oxidoreductase [Halotalea alkalilenta]|uniref:NAD(P)/FAD-dependent oxidoreductase n=1 Tax=Halotalea alkalilenta TaxID=376489 RepID=UPI0004815A7A|nr:FAD-binding oxidoreductase [Halotalea alkalilenta]
MNQHFDVIVIGAGISGSATAYSLAKEGHSVAVIDRFAPAAMASGWTLAGVRQSGRDPAELPLARAAVAIWETLHEELEAPLHYTRKGNLRLARNEDEYDQVRRMVAEQARLGLALTFLPDNQAIRAVAPRVSTEILGASWCPSDGHADPHATVNAYVAAAGRRGVSFLLGQRVSSICTEGGRVTGVVTEHGRIGAACVVLTAGVLGNELLNPLGLEVPLDVQMVTVIRSVPVAPLIEPVIGVAGGDWAGRQQLDGRLRITSGVHPWHGGMSIDTGMDGPRPVVPPRMESVAEVVAKLEQLLPGASAAPVEALWAGLIDLTPDALPVIATAPGIDGLVVGMGFSGHGFCLGPVTGMLLADLALGRPPRHALDAFSFERFAAGRAGSVEPPTLHG